MAAVFAAPARPRIIRAIPLASGLRALPRDSSWRDFAACAETDPEVFFLEKGESPRPARRVCASCPVRLLCLEAALDRDEQFGIWGGLTETERRRFRSQGNKPDLCRNRKHLMDEVNTQIAADGGRRCLACRAASVRRRNEQIQRERAAGAAPASTRKAAA